MNSISDTYIGSIIDKIAKAFNLKDYTHTLNSFQCDTQNYFGILIPVDIYSKKPNNEIKHLSIVLKLAPTEESLRVSGAITTFFTKEIFVYSKLFPSFNKIESKFSLQTFIRPECLYTCDEYCKEFIAMQDMRSENYLPIGDATLDIDHAITALEALAKFHALSFILKEVDIPVYNDMISFCIPLTEKSGKRFMTILLDRLEKAIQNFGNSNKDLLQKLYEHCSKYVELAVTMVSCTCICHGDMWKENILFKYKDTKPISACIIDYQTARLCSPAFDVLYLITSSTSTGLRKQFFYKLLDVYYENFDQMLKDANLESQKLYSRDMFDRDLKIVAPKCFIVANTAMWLSSGLQQEGNVRSKIKISTEEEKSLALNKYKSLIQAIIDDYYAYGYFDYVK